MTVIESMRDREKVAGAWEDAAKGHFPGVKKVKHLIYDTYTYFTENERGFNSILREDLSIYMCISRSCVMWGVYPGACEDWEYDTCIGFAEALCHGIETGFKGGYRPYTLVLGSGSAYRIPAGCAAPEADMSSYERFEAAFDEESVYRKELYHDEGEW